MTNASDHNRGEPRARYLLLAALIFVLAASLLAVLWQVPRLFPGLAGPPTLAVTPATATPMPTPTLALRGPAITEMTATADDAAGTISFHLAAEVPADQTIARVLLWYDTEAGHGLRRIDGPLSHRTAIDYRLDPAREGLTRTVTGTHDLDYWWLVQDTAGEAVRAGGTLILGPELRDQITVAPPSPSAPAYTWTLSETQHFTFYYLPGSAAERDRFQIGPLAEDSLDHISAVLEVAFQGQMAIYLVPRVFWQGGAAYGDKVQLISYLDRNYTGIEIWSYFTHEGTHALAQDLIQPKENGGGPDGVLVEGLAVWASGGHYRHEPLDAWAAVVAASDDYLPLAELRAGPFYDFQHETSYLEAASFVKFLVARYGLARLKELYGRATGDKTHDGALVQGLYGHTYQELEAQWLAHLEALDPSPRQETTWALKVRAFNLMRRYETELDPDARILPGNTPPEWTSDTFKIFTHRLTAPQNVVLETALIAAQERTYGGDLPGATALLDDVEAALDAGGDLDRPALQARREIVDLMAAQDRAILRADARAYGHSLAPNSELDREAAIEATLLPPFVEYDQEVVRLDLAGGDETAEGQVLLHARLADGEFEDDGRLFDVTFVQTPGGWRLWSRAPARVALSLPPVIGD
ncbi:MAG: hypothetical protein PVJ34_19840 [Anaerolineae bacterium]|jgi:hypothetical protein